MDPKQYIPAAVALVGLFALSHFVKQPAVRAAAYGAMGAVVLNQIPYAKQSLA